MRMLPVFCALIAGNMPAFAAPKPETAHLAFVTEYIRELAQIETIRDSGKQELKEADDAEKIPSGIHINTLFQLELQSEVAMLKRMRLNPPYNELIPFIVSFYGSKITVFRRLIEVLTALMTGAAGQKPGANYGGLAAELPTLRARLDYIDQTLFKDGTPLVAMTLLDPKPDFQNHVSHMIITKEEKATLLESLTTHFGAKMDQKSQNFGVSAATVLRGFLNDHKCSDDPWE